MHFADGLVSPHLRTAGEHGLPGVELPFPELPPKPGTDPTSDDAHHQLERLDHERYNDPQAALDEAATLVTAAIEDGSSIGTIARGLGVYGSSARLLGRTAVADRAVSAAVTLADRYALAHLRPDLYLRRTAVRHDQADHEDALLWAERAAAAAPVATEDARILGSVQYSRAYCLFYVGRLDDAAEVARWVADRRPTDTRSRATIAAAHHLLAGMALRRGNAAETDALCAQAMELSPHTRHFEARLSWLKGRSGAAFGQRKAAEKSYLEALEIFNAAEDWVDAALVVYELGGMLADAGADAVEVIAPVFRELDERLTSGELGGEIPTRVRDELAALTGRIAMAS